MKRVLVTGASNIGKAGVATILYNWGQNFDENVITYDYLAQRGLPEKEFQEKIATKGGKIHVPENLKGNKIKRTLGLMKWIYNVIKENDFDIVHVNSDSAYLAAIYIYLAKKAGNRNIITHSHSTMIDDLNGFRRGVKKLLHYICRNYVRKNSIEKLACSKEAGKWMFKNDKTVTIPNGVDLERFKFNEEDRNNYRSSLGIENKFVIGCVGRLSYPKNYIFSIQIFEEILKINENSVFLIIGDGPDRARLENYIKENDLQEKCIMLGNRNDVEKLMSCMDVFLLPSRFEGLGIVYIEAQASGLPTFASDKVPEEAFVSDLIKMCKLSDSAEYWAKEILEASKIGRRNVIEKLDKTGYSIKGASMILQKVYLKL